MPLLFSDSNPGRVLVVDDSPDNLLLISTILQTENFQTDTALDGQIALDKLAEADFDVVLLDVMMPGLNGHEVCRKIRADEKTANLPVVMVTAMHETSDRVKALEAGADDFLAKPVELIEMLARVRSLVKTKRAREELESAYRDLRRAEEMRDSLAAMLVHDLRTPLTTVIASLEMLASGQAGELDELQEEVVMMSMSGSQTLLSLVNELLDISKLESGELQLERIPTDLTGLFGEAVANVAAQAQAKQTQFHWKIAPDLPRVALDDELMRRVLVNLLGNAIKFTPNGGEIFLGARIEDNQLQLWVRDTGEGIKPEDRERIFDKFGQAKSRRSGRRNSTGLGLTFCRLAAEAHGGKIWVESEPEHGSTFWVELPL